MYTQHRFIHHPRMDACIFVIERTGGQGWSACVCHACFIHSHTDDVHVFVTERKGGQGHSECVHTLYPFTQRRPVRWKSTGQDTARGCGAPRCLQAGQPLHTLPQSPCGPPILQAWWELWRSSPLVHFQIHDTGVWTTATLLHTESPGIILYLLDPFTHFATPH